MTACNTEFTKSNMMDLAGLCLRGFLLKYDHLSDYTSTSKISVQLSETYDLKTELQNERMSSLELNDKKLNKMREIRRIFDEEKKRLAKEEALAAKAAKKGAKQVSNPKEKGTQKKSKRKVKAGESQEEPPIVEEGTIVDVSDELLSLLKDKFLHEKEKLDPIYLNLETHKINLREMIVLGGVYFFNLVQRPRQTRVLRDNFVITLSTQCFKFFATFSN